MLPRASGWLLAAAVLAAVSACSSTSAEESAAPSSATAPSATASGPSADPSPSAFGADGGEVRPVPGTGSLGPGFVTPTAPPPPGGTMTPSPGSWSAVTVPAGYTAALLASEDSAPDRRLTAAVKQWAAAHHVALTVVPANDPDTYVTAIQKAIDLHTDLVISTGSPLADPLALVTSAWLDQKFLLVGAELAEPTYNVTAAVWKGTTARGGAEGSGNAWKYDPSTFTVARGLQAVDAGVAAVLRGYAGYVVEVD